MVNNNLNFPNGLLKNTNFLGKIVDITKIDPAAVSTSLTSINALNFNVTEETAIPSPDGRFGIPPGTKFDPIFSTDTSLDTTIFQENTDIYEKFSLSLGIEGRNGDDAAFSASRTCEFITQNTTENKNVVTYSSATHKLYTLRQNIAYDPKKLVIDEEFAFWVTKKLNPLNPSTFNNFIQEVGTHYITSVVYGGLGYQVLKIDSQSITKLKEEHISIATAAQQVMLHSNASYDDKDTYSSFSESTTSKTVFIGGTVLPHLSEDNKTLNFSPWAESVIQEPAAVSIKVNIVSDLLVPDHFPEMNASVLLKIKQGLESAIKNYLKDHKRTKLAPKRVIKIQEPTQHIGFIQNDSPYRSISGFITEFWSTDTYAFPTIRESSPTKFYIVSTGDRHARDLTHEAEVYLVYRDLPHLPREELRDFLSWYTTYNMAYYDSTVDSTGCTWIIEKVNRLIDDTIRDGDVIRIRKSTSQEYISTQPLDHKKYLVTWTSCPREAEFCIKILN